MARSELGEGRARRTREVSFVRVNQWREGAEDAVWEEVVYSLAHDFGVDAREDVLKVRCRD